MLADHRVLRVVFAALLALLVASPALAADRLDEILERGSLRVGVKADYPPWGFLCGGEAAPCPPEALRGGPQPDKVVLAGMEVELARSLAGHLAVTFGQQLELEIVPVTTANRLQRLNDGAVDIVVATMADTPERRQLADLLHPFYYASGVTALVPKTSDVEGLGELQGARVCLTSGAFFNRLLIERYGIRAQIYRGTRDPLIALKTGKCDAYAYDDTALETVIRTGGWTSFRTLNVSVEPHDWVVAVPLGEGDRRLGNAVREKLKQWHASGHLLALEHHWGLGCSSFLVEAFFEQGGNPGAVAAICGTVPSIGPDDAPDHVVADNYDREAGGPRLEAYHWHMLLSGFVLTAALSLGSILGALTLGLSGSFLLVALPAWFIRPLGALTILFQTTPPLLQLYIVFFGIAPAVAKTLNIEVSALAVAVLVFSLYAGVAVSGLISQAAADRGIAAPADLTAALPGIIDDTYAGLIAHLVNIVKAVGMASVIAVPEVISAVTAVAAERGHVEEMMTGLLLFYLAFVWLVLLALKGARTRLIEWLNPTSSPA